ncbi:trehalose-phosphatase [Blastococcus sp. Marseille-P5729]|uniref:trehalose-phosphatase n=1 Tax=Blastococcus sp. Marseille-P5729 TaxID=2086582 RepID=UPI000D0F12B0|nr:trehalose-phosphatase [Blastococcus sp. Marseille-P5729]
MPRISELVNAFTQFDTFEQQAAGRRVAIFSDYDGVLTPIVDRPEDAVITPQMGASVRRLSTACSVCIVSGRDREVVQELMGVDDLVVAGSHGFDIWSPSAGAIEMRMGGEHKELIEQARDQVTEELSGIDGVLIEPKLTSVAVHYRLVSPQEQKTVTDCVERILAAHPDSLKVTPGKMVLEIQPKVEWDKGRAVLYLMERLGLDGPDVVPVYLGDDITDEHAFSALRGRGIGIFVGTADDPEVADRHSDATLRLDSPDEVQRFFDRLASELIDGDDR